MRLIELAKGALVADIMSIAPPVIAAVEGFALGGGFALAAACDFVVTGADAKWHMPEAQNGWIPPWGLESIKLRVGHYKARQLVCGLRLSGDEAVVAGVADKVTAPGQALDGARKIAADLAAIDPQVLATIKKFFGSDIDKQLGKSDEKSAALFKGNCQYEPAVSTLSRFGVRNV
jgi:enoyl-CoA hydratase/carnithine racemase